jgi:nanoRNase/pAp phosphatase (c-di-AMP/oligoRNAs hydrolase)
MSHGQGAEARRVHDLRAFVAGSGVVPILLQRDPDPDGMASAVGVRVVLHRDDRQSPIISLGEVTRPENRRMAELLDIRVTRVTDRELSSFQQVVCVDTQPRTSGGQTRFAIIDHHPPRPGYTADFMDIRPELGAAATMVTQYLRASGERINPSLATGLLYGIRTDTDVLRRGTSGEDVEAYAFLQDLADEALLRRIGRPAFSEAAMTAVGEALTGLRKEGDVAVAYVGRLDERTAHVLPNLADFCLAIEGVSWSAAGGLVGNELVLNLRRSGGGVGAGDLARALAKEEGMGGGHHVMARVAYRLHGDHDLPDDPGDRSATDWLLKRVMEGIEGLRAIR